MNKVRDYNKLQGYTNYTDRDVQIVRDINHRLVIVENSGDEIIEIAISSYPLNECSPNPQKNFTLYPKRSKAVALNSVGEDMQYIYIYRDGLLVNQPTALRWDSNNVVIRQGLDFYFVQFFRKYF